MLEMLLQWHTAKKFFYLYYYPGSSSSKKKKIFTDAGTHVASKDRRTVTLQLISQTGSIALSSRPMAAWKNKYKKLILDILNIWGFLDWILRVVLDKHNLYRSQKLVMRFGKKYSKIIAWMDFGRVKAKFQQCIPPVPPTCNTSQIVLENKIWKRHFVQKLPALTCKFAFSRKY